MLWWMGFTTLIAYALGYYDGRIARPPPPEKGNFEGCEDKEEQEKEYPDQWFV